MRKSAFQKAVTGALVAAFLYGLVPVLQIGVRTGVYAASSTHTVVIEGMKFVPETITVKQGDTIVWVNKDLFPHTATARGIFDSGELAVNQTWKYTVSKPGKFPYICTLHPTMKATLVVE
jgi:plastocyanin